MNRIDGLTKIGIKYTGFTCHPYILIDDETVELRSMFIQEKAKRGFLIHSGAWNLCYSHRVEDTKHTTEAVEESIQVNPVLIFHSD
jgi:hypothetical protein